jgi:hypothetical protein
MLESLKFWKRKPKSVQYKIIERELSKVTVEEWRSDEMRCATALAVLKSPTVIQMLQTLYNSHPAFNVLTTSNPQDRIVQQAQGEGYTMALRDFELLGSFVKQVELPEADFNGEDFTEEQLKPFRINRSQK